MALFTAFVCLWISTVGAIHHHHDGVAASGASSASPSSLRHAPPPAPDTDEDCAACAWEQAFSMAHTPQIHVVSITLSIVLIDAPLTEALRVRHFSYTSLRAPPAPLA
jgi:hypothetical protein